MALKSKKRIGKKGSISDLPMVMIILLAFAICTLIAWTIWAEWQDKYDAIDSNDYQRNITESASIAIKAMDWIFIILFIGLTIATIVLAFQIPTRPAMFFISLMLVIFMIVLAGILADVFTGFEEAERISNATSTFTTITTFFDLFPTYMLIVGFLIMIALYAKYKIAE